MALPMSIGEAKKRLKKQQEVQQDKVNQTPTPSPIVPSALSKPSTLSKQTNEIKSRNSCDYFMPWIPFTPADPSRNGCDQVSLDKNEAPTQANNDGKDDIPDGAKPPKVNNEYSQVPKGFSKTVRKPTIPLPPPPPPPLARPETLLSNQNFQSQYPGISIDPYSSAHTMEFLKQIGVKDALDDMRSEFKGQLADLEKRLDQKIEEQDKRLAQPTELDKQPNGDNCEHAAGSSCDCPRSSSQEPSSLELLLRKKDANIGLLKQKLQVSEALLRHLKDDAAVELKAKSNKIEELRLESKTLQTKTTDLQAKLKKSEATLYHLENDATLQLKRKNKKIREMESQMKTLQTRTTLLETKLRNSEESKETLKETLEKAFESKTAELLQELDRVKQDCKREAFSKKAYAARAEPQVKDEINKFEHRLQATHERFDTPASAQIWEGQEGKRVASGTAKMHQNLERKMAQDRKEAGDCGIQ